MSNEYIIKDKDAVFAYFTLVEEIGPRNILDIGMFLKRCGVVGRCMMGVQISDDIALEGIDIKDSPSIGIYEKIYDEIHMELPKKKYDIVLAIKPEPFRDILETEGFMEWCNENTSILVIDADIRLKGTVSDEVVIRNFLSGSEEYNVIIFHELVRGD